MLIYQKHQNRAIFSHLQNNSVFRVFACVKIHATRNFTSQIKTTLSTALNGRPGVP